MKKLYFIIFIASFIVTSVDLSAKVSLSGQFKPRFEYRDGFRKLTTEMLDPAAFVSQRTRLILNYSNSNIKTRISAQDVRVWGDETQLRSEPRLALHEGWAEVLLDEDFSLKLGRQELVYDDHRIFGNVDWAQQGRSHDAAIAKYETQGMRIHLGGAFNQSNEALFSTNYTLSNYKGLGFFWLENEIDSNMRFTLLGITDAFQQSDTVNINYFRNTLGGNFYYTSSSIDLQGTGYYQFGKTINDLDISAYMFSLQGYYKSNDLKIGAGIDYLSGNNIENGNSNEYGAFNTLFGTNHKFYGLIDQFIDIPANTAGGGLVDIYAKIKYNLTKKLIANLDYHNFSLEKSIINPATSELTERGLASEIDFVMTYKFAESVKFQCGYSYLVPTESLKIVQGRLEGQNSQWTWLMVVVTPEFFGME